MQNSLYYVIYQANHKVEGGGDSQGALALFSHSRGCAEGAVHGNTAAIFGLLSHTCLRS